MAGRRRKKATQSRASYKFAGIGKIGGAVTFFLGDRSDHRGAGAPTGKDGGEGILNAVSREHRQRYLHLQLHLLIFHTEPINDNAALLMNHAIQFVKLQ